MKLKKPTHGSQHGTRRSLNGRILKSTLSAILLLLVMCCAIMVLSMQSLTSAILMDNLQPMARQSAKTVEANIHLLADRMVTIAEDSRLLPVVAVGAPTETEGAPMDATATQANRRLVLDQAREVYELYTIGLYDLEGTLIQGDDNSPARLEESFFSLLQATDNLTTDSSTLFQEKLGITMGMPVKQDGSTVFYVVGIYKYDVLHDVLSNINVGKRGLAMIISRTGEVVGHPDQNIVLRGSTLSELYGEEDSEMYSRLTDGETGATETTLGSETMILAYSPVRGTQWALMVEVPKSDYAYLTNRAIGMTAVAALILLLISVGVIFRLSRSISSSVKRMTSRIVSLADGDLHSAVEQARSGDELELMSCTLSATVESINQYISEIEEVLGHIAAGNLNVEPEGYYKGDFALIRDSLSNIIRSMNETMHDFSVAALDLSHEAERLSGRSGELHQASMEQSDAADELVSKVSQVKEGLDLVTQNTDQTRNKTEEITQRIGDANARMKELSQTMDRINVNANEITKISKAIGDIAAQTNILSINASVEAARAGAAGKGFSVVANEVKQLAAKSAESAKMTTDMVANTLHIIQSGVSLTADTADALRSISQVSVEIRDITQHLSESVGKQQNALNAMEQQIDTISSIASRNLQSAQESEQSSGLLAQEADELQNKVGKFTLKEGIKA